MTITTTRARSARTRTEWVALETWVDESAPMFYEAGGIYLSRPRCKWTSGARRLDPAEHVASCPRCGQRFAATDDDTAEANRNLHFEGDEDCPSICLER